MKTNLEWLAESVIMEVHSYESNKCENGFTINLVLIDKRKDGSILTSRKSFRSKESAIKYLSQMKKHLAVKK